jgi:hypothetical protein
MKVVAGVLVLLVAPSAAVESASPGPDNTPQEWLADPVLPTFLKVESTWPEEALAFEIPPLQDSRPENPFEQESPFPRAIDGLDVQAWREEQEVLRIREWSSQALLGLPLVVPQLVMEALIPRGIAVGPATFLYRSSSSSLPLVVLDQILFHEAEFLARAQAASDDPGYSEDLTRHQKRVLRKAFTGGFRATYVVPGMTMDQVFAVAGDQGIIGYLLAPPAAGAILYFKGIDQKIRAHEDVRLRIKLAGGEDWVRGAGETDGLPVLSFDLRLFDLPVGILGSFDLSRHGLVPEFLGIGTSLDAVEDLLGREAALRNPEFRER